MSVGNDTVKHNLVKVGSLKFQHLINTVSADSVSNLLELLRNAISTTESSINQLLAVLLEKIIRLLMSTGRNLDQLSKAVADLGLGKSSQKGKIKECVRGRVVGSQTVLVAAIVYGDFD